MYQLNEKNKLNKIFREMSPTDRGSLLGMEKAEEQVEFNYAPPDDTIRSLLEAAASIASSRQK